MNEIKDVIQLLQFLIPGFLSAWIFYGTTSFPKPTAFERIIQALVFTFIVNALVFITKWLLECISGFGLSLGEWGAESLMFWSAIYATAIGFMAAYLANSDKLHEWLRKRKLTRETSYPSEWFGSFLKGAYVVLHLADGKRIYGWPLEWPSNPEEGHFVLTDMVWLQGENVIQMPGVDRVLISSKDVKFIQYMENQGGNSNV